MANKLLTYTPYVSTTSTASNKYIYVDEVNNFVYFHWGYISGGNSNNQIDKGMAKFDLTPEQILPISNAETVLVAIFTDPVFVPAPLNENQALIKPSGFGNRCIVSRAVVVNGVLEWERTIGAPDPIHMLSVTTGFGWPTLRRDEPFAAIEDPYRVTLNIVDSNSSPTTTLGNTLYTYTSGGNKLAIPKGWMTGNVNDTGMMSGNVSNLGLHTRLSQSPTICFIKNAGFPAIMGQPYLTTVATIAERNALSLTYDAYIKVTADDTIYEWDHNASTMTALPNGLDGALVIARIDDGRIRINEYTGGAWQSQEVVSLVTNAGLPNLTQTISSYSFDAMSLCYVPTPPDGGGGGGGPSPVVHNGPYHFDTDNGIPQPGSFINFGHYFRNITGGNATFNIYIDKKVIDTTDMDNREVVRLYATSEPHADAQFSSTHMCVFTDEINTTAMANILSQAPVGTCALQVIDSNTAKHHVVVQGGALSTVNLSMAAHPQADSTGADWNAIHATCPIDPNNNLVPVEHDSPYRYTRSGGAPLAGQVSTGTYGRTSNAGSNTFTLYVDRKLVDIDDADNTQVVSLTGVDSTHYANNIATNVIYIFNRDVNMGQMLTILRPEPIGTCAILITDSSTVEHWTKVGANSIGHIDMTVNIVSGTSPGGVDWPALHYTFPVTHHSPYYYDAQGGAPVGNTYIATSNYGKVDSVGSMLVLYIDTKLINTSDVGDDTITQLLINSSGHKAAALAAEHMCVFTSEMSHAEVDDIMSVSPDGTVGLHVENSSSVKHIFRQGAATRYTEAFTSVSDGRSPQYVIWSSLPTTCPREQPGGGGGGNADALFDNLHMLPMLHSRTEYTNTQDTDGRSIKHNTVSGKITLPRGWLLKRANIRNLDVIHLDDSIADDNKLLNILAAVNSIALDPTSSNGSKANLPTLNVNEMVAGIVRVSDTECIIWGGYKTLDGEFWHNSGVRSSAQIGGTTDDDLNNYTYLPMNTTPTIPWGVHKLTIERTWDNDTVFQGDTIYHRYHDQTSTKIRLPLGLLNGQSSCRESGEIISNSSSMTTEFSDFLRTAESICFDGTSSTGNSSNLASDAPAGGVAIVRSDINTVNFFYGNASNEWVAGGSGLTVRIRSNPVPTSPFSYSLVNCDGGEIVTGCAKDYEAVISRPITDGMPGEKSSMDISSVYIDDVGKRLYFPVLKDPYPCNPSSWACIAFKKEYGNTRWEIMREAATSQFNKEFFITNRNGHNGLPNANGNCALVHPALPAATTSVSAKFMYGDLYNSASTYATATLYSPALLPCYLVLTVEILTAEPSLGFIINANTLYVHEASGKVYFPHLYGSDACNTRSMAWMDFKADYGDALFATLQSAGSIIIASCDENVIGCQLPVSDAGTYMLFRHGSLSGAATDVYQVNVYTGPSYDTPHGDNEATPWNVTMPDCCRPIETTTQVQAQVPFSDTHAMVFELLPESLLGYVTLYLTNTDPSTPARISMYISTEPVPADADMFLENYPLNTGVPKIIKNKRILKGQRLFVKTSTSTIAVRGTSVEETE